MVNFIEYTAILTLDYIEFCQRAYESGLNIMRAMQNSAYQTAQSFLTTPEERKIERMTREIGRIVNKREA